MATEHNIKGILLDYDGVMNEGGDNDPFARLALAAEITKDAAKEILWPLWPGYIRGKLPELALWSTIEQQIGHAVPLAARDIWSHAADLQPDPRMVAFVQHLRNDRKLPVGLLSNVTPTTKDEMLKTPAYNGFSFVDLSSETGLAKPEDEAYLHALAQFPPGTRPQEVIFVDDQEERNLTPAKNLGFIVVKAVSIPQTIATVSELIAA